MGRAVKNSLEIVIKMALPGTLNFLNTILANTGNIAQFAPEAKQARTKAHSTGIVVARTTAENSHIH